MANYSTVLNQLLHLIPRYNFEHIVKSCGADKYVKTLKCWNQFTALLYAQASGKTTLREIIQGIEINNTKLYHLGMPLVKRSTLAEANQNRSYEIYEKLFYKTVALCKSVTPKHDFKFKNPLYTFDASTIDLCLSAYSWAKFRTTKGAFKIHCLYNHSGSIPDFIHMTDAKVADVTVAKTELDIIPDSIYCFDKAYSCFELWANIDLQKGYFVSKLKRNIKYEITGQHTETLKKGILSDEIIRVGNKKYKKKLRMIRHFDMEKDELTVLITNNFKLAPATIAKIYKSRWEIEIFFRWIKQELKIKSFLGTSKNAVMTQVWIAMIYYLLLSYIKYQSKYGNTLYYLHRIIKEALTARLSLMDLLRVTPSKIRDFKISEIQHSFW
jgi:energy-coupling factor transporter ATP-binding protein EcfA2